MMTAFMFAIRMRLGVRCVYSVVGETSDRDSTLDKCVWGEFK